MGTSASYGTPTKGNWGAVHEEINELVNTGPTNTATEKVFAKTVKALVSDKNRPVSSTADRIKPIGTTRAVVKGGKGGAKAHSRRDSLNSAHHYNLGGFISSSAGNAISRGAGFLRTVQESDFQTALEQIGLKRENFNDLMEVVDILSEAIIGGRLSLDQEIANLALNQTFIEIMESDPEGQEKSINQYMESQGIQGFIETFLSKYSFEKIWLNISGAIHEKMDTGNDIEAFYDSLEKFCSSEVKTVVNELSNQKELEKVDWFGKEGEQITEGLIQSLTDTALELLE